MLVQISLGHVLERSPASIQRRPLGGRRPRLFTVHGTAPGGGTVVTWGGGITTPGGGGTQSDGGTGGFQRKSPPGFKPCPPADNVTTDQRWACLIDLGGAFYCDEKTGAQMCCVQVKADEWHCFRPGKLPPSNLPRGNPPARIAAASAKGWRIREDRRKKYPEVSVPGFTASACLYRTTNQYRASLAKVPLTESDVRGLHRLAMQRAGRNIAGQYSNVDRYVRTEAGRHKFPSPAEVPILMRSFARWLESAPNTPEIAFAAHRHLVDTHPFNDGNGRTARLLMNLILIRGGYPPIAVRPKDRPSYLRTLQQSQAGCGTEAFDTLLYERLRATMGFSF